MTSLEGTTSSSRDVVAVTEARDLDVVPPIGGSPQNLPNEVLLIIFKPLKKTQLKAVRSVCKLFSQLVSPLLFDEIYISPHKQNLDVFRQISEHQDLSKYPRRLIYDVQEFQDNIDPQKYYKDLCRQLRFFLTPYPKTSIQHVDKELEGLLRMVKSSSNPAKHDPSDYKKYSTCRIVQRGLEIYLERAEEQDHYNGGELLACLCIGLMRLTHIDKVTFQCVWSRWHLRAIDWSKNPRDLRLSSGPLARIWSPFHLQPGSGAFHTPMTVEFDNVISAFSLTGRPLRVLNGDTTLSVAYEIFNSKSSLSRTFRQHSFPAMCYLEHLSLSIDMRRYPQSGSVEDFEDSKEKTPSVDFLAVALRLMPGLRSLSLHGSISDTGNGLLSIGELFHTFPFPALEVLVLSGILGSEAQFSAFLRTQLRLRELSLGAIELSEGTWVGLVDDMRRRLFLDSLDIDLPLRENGGVDVFDEVTWFDLEMPEKIEQYVLYGGEHPLRRLHDH